MFRYVYTKNVQIDMCRWYVCMYTYVHMFRYMCMYMFQIQVCAVLRCPHVSIHMHVHKFSLVNTCVTHGTLPRGKRCHCGGIDPTAHVHVHCSVPHL